MDLPERTNETPGRSYKVYKHTDRARLFDMTINGVSDHRGGNDLVSSSSDSHTHDRSDVVSRDVLELNAKDDEANHDEGVADVGQPESVLWCRLAPDLLVTVAHEPIREATSQLLTKECTDDNADELKSDALWVEAELW